MPVVRSSEPLALVYAFAGLPFRFRIMLPDARNGGSKQPKLGPSEHPTASTEDVQMMLRQNYFPQECLVLHVNFGSQNRRVAPSATAGQARSKLTCYQLPYVAHRCVRK